MSKTDFHWVSRAEEVSELAKLFVANTDTSYISHGEVIDGRASDLGTWIPDLLGFMTREFGTALEPGKDGKQFKLACMTHEGTVAGLAFLTIETESGIAILQDLVINSDLRGRRLGTLFLAWLEPRLREMGIRQLFLESGVQNESAYAFFHAQGFKTSSVVMNKPLTSDKPG